MKKKLTVETMNPCNQFIIRHLLRLRGRPNQNVHDHKFFIYSHAISSVKKYPLPIICSDQLKILSGVGQFMVKELTNLIKQHYKKYLKQPPNQEEEQPQQRQYSQIALSQNNDEISEDFTQTLTQTNFSTKSQTHIKTYRPRSKTLSFRVLYGMRLMQAENISVSKEQICQYLNQKHQEKLKKWPILKNTLMNSGYIEQDGENQSFFLTQKGADYLQIAESKQKLVESKKKVQQQAQLMKVKRQISQVLEKYSYSDSQTMEKPTKKKLQLEPNSNLTILIDSREMKDQSQRQFFQEKLSEKYKIAIETTNLAIGDFAWRFGDEILNYIVERKKADDLASSIIDGRYKEQKFRLKNSGIDNIFYLYEGYPSSSCAKSEKQLDNALLKTKVMDGFKVVRVKAINESARFLAETHYLLIERLKSRANQMETLGTLEEFNKKNNKSSNLTVENIFGLSLKVLPNIGKQTVNSILKYFKTFTHLRKKLQEFQSEEEKVQFLTALLKGGRSQSKKMVVDLLFKQNYN